MTRCEESVRVRLLGGALVGLIFMLPDLAAAEPNENSIAELEACLVETHNARVCSSKELSNVIVHCDNGDGTSYFFKYDDLDDPESPGVEFLVSSHEGVFPCPEGEDVLGVFVKSGSGKYDGEPLEGLPPGAGAVFFPQECPVDFQCPEPAEEEEEEEEEEETPL